MRELATIVGTAFFSGFVYFVLWVFFRARRHSKFKIIRAAHSDERLLRANFKSQIAINSTNAKLLRANESMRIARWEALNGVLSDELALLQREESYWTTGAAIQGASAVGTAVLVAFLVWGSGRFATGSNQHSESGVSVVANASETYIQFAQGILPYLVIAAIMGAILMATSKRNLGKAAGFMLLAGGATAIGKVSIDVRDLTLFKLDKIPVTFNIKPKNTFDNETNEPVAQKAIDNSSFKAHLPPFIEASHSISPQIACFLAQLLPTVTKNAAYLQEITVVSSADRRELLPEPKRKYTNNWGLARRRAESIQEVLFEAGIPKNKITSLSIGPNATDMRAKEPELSLDRRATLRIYTTNDEAQKAIANSTKDATIACELNRLR